jgi:hypothetical protein
MRSPTASASESAFGALVLGTRQVGHVGAFAFGASQSDATEARCGVDIVGSYPIRRHRELYRAAVIGTTFDGSKMPSEPKAARTVSAR